MSTLRGAFHLSNPFFIDITAGKLASKSNVQLYTLNNTNAQQFMFLASSSSGYYNIAPFYAPTLFFNIDGGTSASLVHGANIHLYTAVDRANERFKFDYSNNNGYYELKSYYGTNIDDEVLQLLLMELIFGHIVIFLLQGSFGNLLENSFINIYF